MSDQVHLAAMSGSLRKGSFNTMLLHAALELLPANTTMTVLSIAELPLYNADLDLPLAQQRPDVVTRFRDELAKADGVLFVSPEYNYSVPGGLKNAFDWASRGDDSPLLRKIAAVMGATTGMWGTVRMQMAFQALFLFMDMRQVMKPEVLVAKAQEKFDEQGRLKDEMARGLVAKKLQALRDEILLRRK